MDQTTGSHASGAMHVPAFFRQHGLLAPGVRALRRIGSPAKSARVSAAFLMPIVLLAWALCSTASTNVNFSAQERVDSFKLYASGVRGLLLSGGGNDIAGMDDFLRLLKPDCSQAAAVEDCFAPGQPDAIMEGLDAAYRELIARFRAWNGSAPVFLHQYDYAWPTGQGLFGPADWLKAPMDAAKVPAALRRPLFKQLIGELKLRQIDMSLDAALGTVVVMDTAGVLPEDDDSMWANELHPTPSGFRRIVKRAVLPALQDSGIG